MDIREALSQLDSMEDDHWTSDGAPKLDKVSELVGSKVSRAEVIEAAPKFSRENMELPESPEGGEEQSKEETAPHQSSGLLEEFCNSEVQTPEEFLIFLKKLPKEELQALEKILIHQQSAIQSEKNKVEELARRTSIALGQTRARIKKELPDFSNQEAIQEYIKSQNEQRARKHSATSELLKGVDLKSLDPRAPIDRAFARKTSRGTQRPTR